MMPKTTIDARARLLEINSWVKRCLPLSLVNADSRLLSDRSSRVTAGIKRSLPYAVQFLIKVKNNGQDVKITASVPSFCGFEDESRFSRSVVIPMDLLSQEDLLKSALRALSSSVVSNMVPTYAPFGRVRVPEDEEAMAQHIQMKSGTVFDITWMRFYSEGIFADD
jgi:hypothetical protein